MIATSSNDSGLETCWKTSRHVCSVYNDSCHTMNTSRSLAQSRQTSEECPNCTSHPRSTNTSPKSVWLSQETHKSLHTQLTHELHRVPTPRSYKTVLKSCNAFTSPMIFEIFGKPCGSSCLHGCRRNHAKLKDMACSTWKKSKALQYRPPWSLNAVLSTLRTSRLVHLNYASTTRRDGIRKWTTATEAQTVLGSHHNDK